MTRRLWTPAEDSRLCEAIGKVMPHEAVLSMLGRTSPAVRKRMYFLGIHYPAAYTAARRAIGFALVNTCPVLRDKRQKSLLKSWENNPERRALLGAASKARDAMGTCIRIIEADPEKSAYRIERSRIQQAKVAASRLAWCPESYRVGYLSLMRKYGKAEARRVTELDVARDARRIEAAKPRLTWDERLAAGLLTVEYDPGLRAPDLIGASA